MSNIVLFVSFRSPCPSNYFKLKKKKQNDLKTIWPICISYWRWWWWWWCAKANWTSIWSAIHKWNVENSSKSTHAKWSLFTFFDIFFFHKMWEIQNNDDDHIWDSSFVLFNFCFFNINISISYDFFFYTVHWQF